jgi:hypothetical protein
MADEQPNTPSADVSSSAVEAAPADSQAPVEQESSAGRSWWDRIMGRAPRDGQETAPDAKDRAQASQAAKALTLTEEELDRRIQAETDRREAKRAQEARARQRRELRDKDPWAYAEEDRKDEQSQLATGQLEQFLVGIGTEHDRVSIDPVVERLPAEERERILKLEGAGTGLNGRKLVVTEAMKALEKHWRAEGAKEAEARLRRNPAFRKQILAETRGGSVEPELLPAASASAPESSVSALLRQRYGIGAG